jgi:hypothetical protein
VVVARSKYEENDLVKTPDLRKVSRRELAARRGRTTWRPDARDENFLKLLTETPTAHTLFRDALVVCALP